MLYVGRSLGDEPLLITQLVRIAFQGVSTQAAEPHPRARRTGRGCGWRPFKTTSSPNLRSRSAYTRLRGERALTFNLFGGLDSGEVSLSELSDGSWQPSRIGPLGHLMFHYSQGICLHHLNRAVEIAKRPAHEQTALWKQWKTDFNPKTKSPADMFGGAAGLFANAGH